MHVIMVRTLFYKLGMLLLLAAVLCGCIKNDIPFARIPLSITALKVEGQIGTTSFSEKDRTATVTLAETVNPKKVKIDSIGYTDKAVAALSSGDVIDLTNDVEVTLSLYQDYVWKIMRNQPIERRLTVSNQVGNAVFDEDKRLVTINITKSASLRDVELVDLKLGPTGAAYNGSTEGLPAVSWSRYANYAETTIHVTYSDFIDEEWTVKVYNSDSDVLTERADGWVNVAWMYGAGVAGTECGFEYREAGAENWIAVPKEYVTVNGGQFYARVPHLKANTTYECRAFSDGQRAKEVQFSTVDMGSFPNMGFEDWHKSEKSVICPWAKDGSVFWDTGNHGSAIVGEKNVTTNVKDIRPGSTGQYAACLSSQNILGVKFAAGNLFVGEYKKTQGTNGILGFGREFVSYPTALKGWFKYKTAPITEVSKGYEKLKNQPDTCIVWVALGDWELTQNAETGQKTAVEIRTDNNNNGKYFDKNDPHVIAYGEMTCGEDVNEYKSFEVKLDYRATNRVPTSLLIVCSASKYGDYFTGGESVMWIDDFSLVYDYED